MCTGEMVRSDFTPRNIDITTRWPDSDINDNWYPSCFRNRRPQISKLLAFGVSCANDEDAPHLEISGLPAASMIKASGISQPAGRLLIASPC